MDGRRFWLTNEFSLLGKEGKTGCFWMTGLAHPFFGIDEPQQHQQRLNKGRKRATGQSAIRQPQVSGSAERRL
jgi:hypothetical protein